jgi:hypothetical protein
LPSASSVSAGTFENALSVGANTVYGPLPDSVSARSALMTSDSSVSKRLEATTVSVIVFFGLAAFWAGASLALPPPARATVEPANRAPAAIAGTKSFRIG